MQEVAGERSTTLECYRGFHAKRRDDLELVPQGDGFETENLCTQEYPSAILEKRRARVDVPNILAFSGQECSLAAK